MNTELMAAREGIRERDAEIVRLRAALAEAAEIAGNQHSDAYAILRDALAPARGEEEKIDE